MKSTAQRVELELWKMILRLCIPMKDESTCVQLNFRFAMDQWPLSTSSLPSFEKQCLFWLVYACVGCTFKLQYLDWEEVYSRTCAEETAPEGTSLVVQWLRLSPFSAGSVGLIPDLGTKIPYALQQGQNKLKKKIAPDFKFKKLQPHSYLDLI